MWQCQTEKPPCQTYLVYQCTLGVSGNVPSLKFVLHLQWKYEHQSPCNSGQGLPDIESLCLMLITANIYTSAFPYIVCNHIMCILAMNICKQLMLTMDLLLQQFRVIAKCEYFNTSFTVREDLAHVNKIQNM